MPAKHERRAVIKGDTRSAQASMTGFQGKVKAVEAQTLKANAAMKAMHTGMLALGAGAAIAVAGIDALADRAVETSNVFGALKISVAEATEAVGHQTTALNVAKGANKLHAAGLKVTADEYARLTGVVAALADAQGEDLDTMMRKVNRSIAKGSDGALKQLGIYSDLESEARRLGRSMTLAEKQQFVLNQVMVKGAQTAKENGVAINGLGQRWVALKNKTVDLVDQQLAANNAMDEGVDSTDALLAALGPMGAVVEGHILLFKELTDGVEGLARAQVLAKQTAIDLRHEMEQRKRLTEEAKKITGDVADVGLQQGPAFDTAEKQRTEEFLAKQKKRGRGGRKKKDEGLVVDPDDFISIIHPDTGETVWVNRAQAEKHREMSAEFAQLMQVDMPEQVVNDSIKIQDVHAKRVEEFEARKRRAMEQTMSAMTGGLALMQQTMMLATQFMGSEGDKQRKVLGKVQGAMVLIGATREVFEAAKDFASQNYVGGAMHAAAATLGFANGALLLSGGFLGSGGADNRTGGGFNPNRQLNTGTPRGGATSPTGGNAFDAPLSPVDQDLARSRGGNTPRGAGGNSGGITINGTAVFGDNASQDLDRMQNRGRRSRGIIGG